MGIDASILRDGVSGLGRIATLSLSGAYLEMESPPEIGAVLCLGFTLGGEELEVNCRVVRPYAADTCWALGLPGGVSVVFEDLRPDHDDLIGDAVKQRLGRLKP